MKCLVIFFALLAPSNGKQGTPQHLSKALEKPNSDSGMIFISNLESLNQLIYKLVKQNYGREKSAQSIVPTKPPYVPDEPMIVPDKPTIVTDELTTILDAPIIVPDESTIVPDRTTVVPDGTTIIPDEPSIVPNTPTIAQPVSDSPLIQINIVKPKNRDPLLQQKEAVPCIVTAKPVIVSSEPTTVLNESKIFRIQPSRKSEDYMKYSDSSEHSSYASNNYYSSMVFSPNKLMAFPTKDGFVSDERKIISKNPTIVSNENRIILDESTIVPDEPIIIPDKLSIVPNEATIVPTSSTPVVAKTTCTSLVQTMIDNIKKWNVLLKQIEGKPDKSRSLFFAKPWNARAKKFSVDYFGDYFDERC